MKLSILVSSLFAIMLASTSVCDEPCEQFLQALRDRGYYDVALDYLEEMETSPLASAEFKSTLPFERAKTLIASTTRVRDLEILEERLGKAEVLLNESEASADSPDLKARSQDYRGDLLFRRARIYLTLAENDRLTANERSDYYKQARGYLKNALAAFGQAKTSYRKILDDFRLDLRDQESKRRLKQLRATYTVVRVKLPQILEKFADTLEAGNPERAKSLESAAADFEQLWLKYPNFPAGLDSCLYAARCRYKLNQYSEALSLLQQILNLPDSSALLVLKRRAMVLASDCWSRIEPYPFDDVIANLEPYNARLTKRDQRISDWQRVQLELARAYHAKAIELKLEDGDPGRIKNFNRDASKLIKSIARLPGDHRKLARELMNDWNLSVESEVEVEETPILTFADAKQKASEFMSELKALHSDVIEFRQQTGSANLLEGNQNELDLATAEQRLEKMANRCLGILERALVLADSSVAREDINQIRYLQAACYYTLQLYYEAALIGEFLVERYPTVPFSRQAGEIAVRSYAILHDRSTTEEKQFERDRLTNMAEKIVDRWPGSIESSTAAATLAKLILSGREVSDEDVESARELIQLVGNTFPDRAVLNLKLGNKYWFSWRRKTRQGDVDEQLLQERLASAIEYLSSGLKSYNSGNLTMEAAWAALFLVEALLEEGRVDEAVKQLESIPIDLVKQKSPVVFKSENAELFVSETYKTAGKTYLAAIRKDPSDKKWIDKATVIVSAMQARADHNSDPKAKQDVINMYRLIAAQMEKQFETISDPAEQKQFADNLSRFLGTLQAESDDPNTLIWAGKTLMNLAESLSALSMESEAKRLFDMAISSLKRAADLGVKDEKLANELKRQQAIAKRGLGNFEEAFNDLVELLNQTPNAWQMQIDAANTLQIWGVRSQSREPLAKALTGTEKYRDPKTKRQKNLVWGWSRLADVLKANPSFRDGYYRSLYGAIETRLEYGLVEQNPKAIASALKKLNMTKARDEQLGGPVWKLKFDKLEQRIRQNMTATEVSSAVN